MQLTLKRYHADENATLGILRITELDHQPIYTLERPWLDNKPYVSCIPLGVYECAPYSSKKYPSVYEVLDVPMRSAILIHIGNFVHETKGCILPGLQVNPKVPMVGNSTSSIELLRELIGKQNFSLKIEEV